MSGITPGPWKANGKFVTTHSSGDYEEVAYVHTDGSKIAKANARAIAAVPEMMEALETVGGYLLELYQANGPCQWDERERHCKGMCEEHGCLQSRVDLVRSALAKAKGETP